MPPEGANVIAVLLADSGDVALERIAQLLVQRGYHVKTRDQQACRLTTDARRLPGGPTAVTVQVIVMGHTALFSGLVSPAYTTSRRARVLSYSAYSHVPFANYDFVAAGWQELEATVDALARKRKVVYFQHP